ncbi:hypothetical protein Z043-125714 [Arapaima gigas]
MALVWRNFPRYVDQHSGCDLVPLPERMVQEALGSGEAAETDGGFLLPLITRTEYKHQTQNPGCSANSFDAVLKGHVSRNVLSESVQRTERDQRAPEGMPCTSAGRARARRTPSKVPD